MDEQARERIAALTTQLATAREALGVAANRLELCGDRLANARGQKAATEIYGWRDQALAALKDPSSPESGAGDQP